MEEQTSDICNVNNFQKHTMFNIVWQKFWI